MEDEVDRLVIAVRADTRGFASDVAALKSSLEQGVGAGADRAGRTIEAALGRAVRSGKLGFDDLARTALTVLGEVASAAIRGGVGAVAGGGGSGGLAGIASGLIGAVLGLPGRATGGPVSPGAAYLVGERGPELFVPTSAGAVAPLGRAGAARDVRVSIAVTAPADAAPRALARSGRQVARAVTAALGRAEG